MASGVGEDVAWHRGGLPTDLPGGTGGLGGGGGAAGIALEVETLRSGGSGGAGLVVAEAG
ncbi:MAG: hypothetical protein ACJAYU_001832 [Bradymonadia bacterium]|jgi:hypothetical protein